VNERLLVVLEKDSSPVLDSAEGVLAVAESPWAGTESECRLRHFAAIVPESVGEVNREAA